MEKTGVLFLLLSLCCGLLAGCGEQQQTVAENVIYGKVTAIEGGSIHLLLGEMETMVKPDRQPKDKPMEKPDQNLIENGDSLTEEEQNEAEKQNFPERPERPELPEGEPLPKIDEDKDFSSRREPQIFVVSEEEMALSWQEGIPIYKGISDMAEEEVDFSEIEVGDVLKIDYDAQQLDKIKAIHILAFSAGKQDADHLSSEGSTETEKTE